MNLKDLERTIEYQIYRVKTTDKESWMYNIEERELSRLSGEYKSQTGKYYIAKRHRKIGRFK